MASAITGTPVKAVHQDSMWVPGSAADRDAADAVLAAYNITVRYDRQETSLGHYVQGATYTIRGGKSYGRIIADYESLEQTAIQTLAIMRADGMSTLPKFNHQADCACALCAKTKEMLADPGPRPTQSVFPCNDCGMDYWDDDRWEEWSRDRISQRSWREKQTPHLCSLCAEIRDLDAKTSKEIAEYDALKALALRAQSTWAAAATIVACAAVLMLVVLVLG